MSEAEKWARIVIFILVGGYAIVVLILTIRFVIRNCFLQRPTPERSRWEQFISENIARSQRAGEAPPEFEEAVTMKVPISVIDIEEPPSYEEYVRKYSTVSTDSMNKTLPLLDKDNSSSDNNINSSNSNNNSYPVPTYHQTQQQISITEELELDLDHPNNIIVVNPIIASPPPFTCSSHYNHNNALINCDCSQSQNCQNSEKVIVESVSQNQ